MSSVEGLEREDLDDGKAGVEPASQAGGTRGYDTSSRIMAAI
jgi:hypothetical protein